MCIRDRSNGASILTVHGRTKEQKKDQTGPCNWDIIKKIKQTLKIPVFANGGIYTYEDVVRCLEYTGCDGVMSSEALLENPALFCGRKVDLDDLALEYLEIARGLNTDVKIVRAHLFKILYTGLQKNEDLRDLLALVKSFEEMYDIAKQVKIRRVDIKIEDKFGWYVRYWESNAKQSALIDGEEKNDDKDSRQKGNVGGLSNEKLEEGALNDMFNLDNQRFLI
eukprot:TRINITY_DN9641_c0_g1_i4.p1 TRINITY_DN9641_c0_g1~~TRINITY_DN9641_c0_g1_i4.p1  ORF type:complete len:223 (-),score=29.90 TRINITY_DN9641_c0_g1_i4:20-688(-)